MRIAWRCCTRPTDPRGRLAWSGLSKASSWDKFDSLSLTLTHLRFGRLRSYAVIRVSKDKQLWQELECFLFTKIIICIKEKKGAPLLLTGSDLESEVTKLTLKGSILWCKHLEHVEANPDEALLTLKLSVQDLQQIHLKYSNREQADKWHKFLARKGHEM